MDASHIQEVIFDCFYPDDTDGIPEEAIIVEGIVGDFAFDPKKIEFNRKQIEIFIEDLPEEFIKGGSFINMVADKDGAQWGEQRNAEQLLVLGLATKNLEYIMPKEVWKMMPGGVPYIQRKTA